MILFAQQSADRRQPLLPPEASDVDLRSVGAHEALAI
jgi:hypothetical protein